jgi:hypothetical protein
MPLRGVGKPKPCHELPGTLGGSDHLWFNVSQKQFGAPEQRERVRPARRFPRTSE